MLFPLILFLSAAVGVAPDFARVPARDYEDFETCYGSFEGAEAVLPQLRGQMPPDDFAAVEHAMGNLADDFAGLEMRLSAIVFGADSSDLTRTFGWPPAMAAAGKPDAHLLVPERSNVAILLWPYQAPE